MNYTTLFSAIVLLFFSPMMALAMDDVEQLLQQGDSYASSQRWDQAINAYKQAIALEPDNGMVHYHLGRVLFHKRHTLINENQQKDLRKFLAQSGKPGWEASSFIMDGEDDATEQLLAEEIQQWNKAVTLDDSIAGAHYFLGAYYFYKDHDKSKAKQELQRAIELDPDYPDSYGLLAMVYMAQGQNDAALDCFHAILKKYPEDLMTRHYLAKLYHQMGMEKEGQAEYNRIKQQNPILADELKPLFEN